MDTTQVIAANVRARLAWHRAPQDFLCQELGWSSRTVYNKLGGRTAIRPAELVRLAELFGLPDPGAFYRVPDGFDGVTPVRLRDGGLLPSTKEQPCWSEAVSPTLDLDQNLSAAA
jgi:hypothetical protein